MKNKKLLLFILFIFLISLTFLSLKYISFEKIDKINDYTPEEEITDDKNISLTLYFKDNSSNELVSESKLVSATSLLNNPYSTVIQSLIDGPSSDNLSKIMPNDTKILNIERIKSCIIINFSENLLNFNGDTEKFLIINSILNSLCQFTEINSVKILINGLTNENFSEEYLSL